jgi:hypothetical protein
MLRRGRYVWSAGCTILVREANISPQLQVKYDELADFSEVMAVGTAAGVVPVRSITRYTTGDVFTYLRPNEGPGVCSKTLSQLLNDTMRGKTTETHGWLEEVEEIMDVSVGACVTIEGTRGKDIQSCAALSLITYEMFCDLQR